MSATHPPVQVRHPELKVTLYKMVERDIATGASPRSRTLDGTVPVSERFAGTGRQIDLTPFFSDQSSVVTHKAVRQAAGGFTLTFADVKHGEGVDMESLYGLIEPMDSVEIRMSSGHRPTPGPAPLIMRGFVSTISRSMAVDGNGAPVRMITVQGHDYGKIWQMLRVLNLPFNYIGDAVLGTFPMFVRFGMEVEANIGAAAFVTMAINQIINPHLERMLPADWPLPRNIRVEAINARGSTSITGPQHQEGPIYDVLAHFTDVSVGFNELFIEDREDGVVVVFRPNPAIDLQGLPIQAVEAYRPPDPPPAAEQAAPEEEPAPPPVTEASPDGSTDATDDAVTELPDTVVVAEAPPTPSEPTRATLPYRLPIPGSDVVSSQLARSDQDVANYFWVEGARLELTRDSPARYDVATGSDPESVYQQTYPNNLPSLYGMRPMIVATQMADFPTSRSGQTAEANAERAATELDWRTDRRRVLSLTNRDNVLLESGQIRIKGNAQVRAGGYIELGAGSLAAPYYVTEVTQEYLPFRGYFTVLTVERGQGFVRRIQAGGSIAPYLLEWAGTAAAATDGTAAPATPTAPPPAAPPSTAGAPGTPDQPPPTAAATPSPFTAPAPAAPAPAPAAPAYTPAGNSAPSSPRPMPDWNSPTGWVNSAGQPVERDGSPRRN